MSKLIRFLAIAGVLSFTLAPASADLVTYTVGEDCNGTLAADSSVTPLNCGFEPDYGFGGLPSVLFYSLGFAGVVGGDVVIYEDSSFTQVSDILRFAPVDSPSPNGFFLYSDDQPGETSLADVGFPASYNTTVQLAETSLGDGLTGVVYHPSAGQPGYTSEGVPPFYDITYVIISDTTSNTPEPASVALVLAPLAAIVIRRRKARK